MGNLKENRGVLMSWYPTFFVAVRGKPGGEPIGSVISVFWWVPHLFGLWWVLNGKPRGKPSPFWGCLVLVVARLVLWLLEGNQEEHKMAWYPTCLVFG